MLCWISKKNGNAITLWKNGVGVTETGWFDSRLYKNWCSKYFQTEGGIRELTE